MNRKTVIALTVGAVLFVIGLAIVLLWPEDSSFQVSTAWLGDQPSGRVRLCGGQDVSGSYRRAATGYNDKFSPGSKATFSEGSFLADAEHERYVESIENGSDECDVIVLDVIHMEEFVAKGLLYDMTSYLHRHDRQADFDRRIMMTAEHESRLWGVPKQLDVGVLYYRGDKASPPESWQDVYEQAKARPPDNLPGLRFQVGPYEGLTVILLELAYAADPRPIITEDGETAELDQPHVREALRFLRNAIRERVIPGREQIDTSNLEQYALGRARFLRGWPFVDKEIRKARGSGTTPPTQLARQTRRATAARTEIVPLPPWKRGGESVGVLGGHNLVIPRSAPNPSAALHLIDFMTSQEQVRLDVEEDSQFPVLKDLADEPGLGNRAVLKAIKATNVIARPSIPEYADVSTIISCGVNAILFGPADVAVRDKLQEIDRDVQSVLDGGSSDLKSPGC